jgi:hypothetical protein
MVMEPPSPQCVGKFSLIRQKLCHKIGQFIDFTVRAPGFRFPHYYNIPSSGREFVRQYYTLLNQAPLHLHR